MNPEKYIGSIGIRLVTGALALAAVAAFAAVQTSGETSPAWLKPLALALGLATLAGLIFCFRAVYAGWMRLAKALHAVATVALFGAIYLAVVPLFVIPARWLDPLRLGRRRNAETTFWVPRSQPQADSASLERMS